MKESEITESYSGPGGLSSSKTDGGEEKSEKEEKHQEQQAHSNGWRTTRMKNKSGGCMGGLGAM